MEREGTKSYEAYAKSLKDIAKADTALTLEKAIAKSAILGADSALYGAFGKAASFTGTTLAVGLGFYEIYKSPDRPMEASKQSASFGAGLWAGEFAASVLAGSGLVASFPALGIVGVVIAAAAASYIIEKNWDSISDLAWDGIAKGLNLVDAIADAKTRLMPQIMSDLDATGQALEDMLDHGKDFINNLLDGLHDLPNHYPEGLPSDLLPLVGPYLPDWIPH